MPKEHVIYGMHNTSIVINDNETIDGFCTAELGERGRTRESPNVITFDEVRSRAERDSPWKEIVNLIDAHVPLLIINTN